MKRREFIKAGLTGAWLLPSATGYAVDPTLSSQQEPSFNMKFSPEFGIFAGAAGEDLLDEIAYIRMGDTPGRKEPTTGEINFPNVLQHVHDKGYRGFVGMEHGNSKEGKAGAWATLKA